MAALTRTTVRLPRRLLLEAKKEHINVSEAAREGLEDRLRRRRFHRNLEVLDRIRARSKPIVGGVDRFVRDLRDTE